MTNNTKLNYIIINKQLNKTLNILIINIIKKYYNNK